MSERSISRDKIIEALLDVSDLIEKYKDSHKTLYEDTFWFYMK